MRRALLLVALVTLAFVDVARAQSAPVFHRCADAPKQARCGHVVVPLDRRGEQPSADERTLRVEFERYPRRRSDLPSLGTIVAVQGGPGYSTTISRASYLELNYRLRDRRDVLLVDARGTGRSQPLWCRAFRSTLEGYVRRAGACARQLGERVDYYGTHAAVDDLADVLDALAIEQIDLYGDSYGSYFAQAFAVRHGERLRSLVLDATYPLPGTDPALGDLAEATWRALRLVCARRPSCAARGEDPLAVLQRLVERVRTSPLTDSGLGAEGRRIRVRLDEESLVTLLQSGYYNPPMWRDLLAAIRAFEAGDRAPLLRLIAEIEPDLSASRVRSYSEPLYLAVICHDYPQMWDPGASLELRRAQLALARLALPAERFAPFSATAWTSQPYQGVAACMRWPGPRVPDPPVPPDAPYPEVPTLVLNGDLDNITASSGAQVVASRFPRSTFVELRNSVHVTAIGDLDDCASRILRRFVRALDAGDTSCAERVKEVSTVDSFPLTAADAEPADSRPGDESRPSERRAAAIAAATVADALQRSWLNYSGKSRGLRGGRWSWSGGDIPRFKFDRARFASDVAVSGTAQWTIATGAVRADLRLEGTSSGRLKARWNLHQQLAQARLDGRLGGRELHAVMLAP